MPDIRYVCLSDLHFGEESSLLTNLKEASSDVDPTQASPVMIQLVECLKYLISKNEDQEKGPALILNGDFLELALTTTNQAAMVFERFIELTMPPEGELFGDIRVLPGNHDHHLWEVARETQYVDYMEDVKPGRYLNIPYHATNIFRHLKPVTAYFLTRLIQRFEHLKDMVITTAYPNYGLLGEDGRKCVIFHHGHFIEPVYQLMSTLKTLTFPHSRKPQHIWEIEAENFAWIDFFWSTMGRSGEAGEDVEVVYEKLQSPEQFKEILSDLAGSLAERYDLPGWGNGMEKRILEWFFHAAVDKIGASLERQQADEPLSPSVEERLRAYVEGPLKDQIHIERDYNMPADVTFVFGHTHRPFEKDMEHINGYPQWVNVYNTGGWVVDKVDPTPSHGGAIILVDENLDTISLRMYNEADNLAEYSVRVKQAIHDGERESAFKQRISELVDPAEAPWKTFSETVASDIPIRAKNLRDRINR
jgi:hypothetical protein